MTDSGQRNNPPNHEQDKPAQYKCFLCRRAATAFCWVIGSLKKIDSLITALVTALLAAITLALAFIAYWQYSDTRLHESLVANNRAWIAPEGAIASGDVGGKDDISVQVFYTNVGKGPAIRMNSRYWAGTTVNKENASGQIVVGQNNTCAGLEPQDELGWVVYPTTRLHQDTSVQRQSILPSVKTNKGALFIQGCFIYETMKEIHHSWFCFIVYRNGAFANANATTLCGDGQGAE